jgi:putative PIN family toxin of toxin-antitoxin system
MSQPQVVLDTNILVAALRSSRGASFRLLSLLPSNRFQIHLSVPLVAEYEAVLSRERTATGLTAIDIEDVLDFLCQTAQLHEVYYLWRPFLPDARDEMVLDLAVKAQADFLVTYNKSDFIGIEQFGVKAVNSKEFLQVIGELP